MASHVRDDVLHGQDHPDTHASANRWRHQESGAFARHAAAPREAATGRGSSGGLADFLNTTRVERPKTAESAAGKSVPILVAGNIQHGGPGSEVLGAQHDRVRSTPSSHGSLNVKCGPLLNYRRMDNQTWYGSVLVVTERDGLKESPVVPELRLRFVNASSSHESPGDISNGSNGYLERPGGAINGAACTNGHEQADVPRDGTNSIKSSNGAQVNLGESRVSGTKLYSDPFNTFWRFDLKVPMRKSELHCRYEIPGLTFQEGKKTDRQSFFVPAISQSMRIMFHSCNGFSVGTDEEAWSGAALWNDVLRVHQKTPFHVMYYTNSRAIFQASANLNRLGGGDQIYNDGIRVDGPLRPWTDIGNPIKRREYPFPEDLRKKCDQYYVNNYIRWYSTEPFASANGQIAQLNLWDDHDIIDGFGSYVDEFMRCPVFRGIGGTANKYYLLFQHHLAPPLSTYTTDAPQTTSEHGVGTDPRQLENTYVLQEQVIDPSYIIGSKPGPYVAEHSRSIYARLGASIAFFGIDARTERTRKQVNYPETYDIIFARLRNELSEAESLSNPIQHLIVLLGIPIAYPRLTWLENIFSSPLIAPIKFLNKRFGFGGSFFNHFDGSVDLLDDLDDHYTARTHKKERLFLVHQLQALAAEFSVRISILGGDVHLAAVGRFYSNPKLNVPVSQDHRYMANIISSAIVNKPPPQTVANLLARRNKIHHLDHETDETLMNFFDKDPGSSNKTANFNHVTMPSRNWAMITQNAVAATMGNSQNGHTLDADDAPRQSTPQPKDGHSCLHEGEVNAGTKHKAADEAQHGQGSDGSLDVIIRVEKDQHSKEGLTEHYGMTIPLLKYEGAEDRSRKRDAIHGAFHHHRA